MKRNMIWNQPLDVPTSVKTELAEYSPVEQQILYMRGISSKASAKQFLGKNASDDHDPFLMKGMDRAVRRIESALESGEKVVVYGDYDADGVTSTVLMTEILGNLGCHAGYYIPDRFDEGYGLNDVSISRIANDGTSLIISVDCGIRDVEIIRRASEMGVDVIVIDHHEPGNELPPAAAIINPKQDEDRYPFKSLAGVGLAYKVTQALSSKLESNLHEQVLDLVALGTVADVVRLQGENRLLASRGIERLKETQRPGLREILKIARVARGKISASTIGFIIGPRLNAAGRLGSAERAVKLLATSEKEEAERIAAELELVNRNRQELTEKAVVEAIETIGDVGDDPDVILVAKKGFNEGVVGLVASRLKDRYYRPTFIGARGENHTRGSARSIPGFNVAEALDSCQDILLKHGGHEKAGGFTLKSDRLGVFEQRLREIAEEQLGMDDLVQRLDVDAEVMISDLGEPLVTFQDMLEPCGEGNRAPVLMTKDVYVAAKRAVGKDGKHLKMTLRQGDSSMDAIAFRKGDLVSKLPERLDVAYKLERNEYMGISSLQMNVIDLRW